MGAVAAHARGLLDRLEGEHLLAEVSLVEGPPQQDLVDLLDLREREGLLEETERHRRVFGLRPQSHHRAGEDLGVVECELRRAIGRVEGRLGGVGAGAQVGLLRGDAGERQVANARTALIGCGGFFFNSQGAILRRL